MLLKGEHTFFALQKKRSANLGTEKITTVLF